MWIELELVLFSVRSGETLANSLGVRLMNTDCIEMVGDSSVRDDCSLVWLRGVDEKCIVRKPYRELADILNGEQWDLKKHYQELEQRMLEAKSTANTRQIERLWSSNLNMMEMISELRNDVRHSNQRICDLHGENVRLVSENGVALSCNDSLRDQNVRLTQENETLRRQMQDVRDANVELRKDNMREFLAGMRHGDHHARTALASAIVALEGIRDGKTDASQFDSSVFASACLDQVKALLAEGEAQAKKQQDEHLQREMEIL